METILTILAVGTLNVACFFIGSKLGQKVAKGESIDLPNLNPMDMVRNHKDKMQARADTERMNVILQNIDAYNGTEVGQKDLPR